MDYNKIADKTSLEKTVKALKQKGYEVIIVKNGAEALDQIKKIIPNGALVMNGTSVTLEQIGYKKLLESGKHKWIDLHAQITAQDDKEKRDKLRRESVLSDYYLGSVHALIENGEFVVASNSGSQLPHLVYTSPNLVLVVSTKKIVPSLDEAFKRLYGYVLPLEEKHMKELYSIPTGANKVLIFRGEKIGSIRKVHFILIEENLGF